MKKHTVIFNAQDVDDLIVYAMGYNRDVNYVTFFDSNSQAVAQIAEGSYLAIVIESEIK